MEAVWFVFAGLFCVALFFGGFYLGWLFAGGRIIKGLPNPVGRVRRKRSTEE